MAEPEGHRGPYSHCQEPRICSNSFCSAWNVPGGAVKVTV